MQRTSIATLALGLLVSAFNAPAFAVANFGTYSFLRNTPAGSFTDSDWTAFRAALNDALNEAKDGETRSWQNPGTGANGEFTMLRTVRQPNVDCREVRMTNSAGGWKRTTGQVFCVGDDGVWKLGPARMRSR